MWLDRIVTVCKMVVVVVYRLTCVDWGCSANAYVHCAFVCKCYCCCLQADLSEQIK